MFDDGKLQIKEKDDEYAAHKDDVYVFHVYLFVFMQRGTFLWRRCASPIYAAARMQFQNGSQVQNCVQRKFEDIVCYRIENK